MYRRILVAYDGSDSAKTALQIGIAFAKRPDTELISLTVEERLPRYADTMAEIEEAKEDIDEHFQRLSTEVHGLAVEQGVTVRTMLRQGHEVAMILDAVHVEGIDLLLIGDRGHSRLFEHILGRTAVSVARRARCSMYIARSRGASAEAGPFKRILVGLDGSPCGRVAFHAAVELAASFGGTMLGVTVREVSPLGRSQAIDDTYVEQLQSAAEEHARTAAVAFEGIVCTGHAGRWLCDLARERQADVIVLGATGLENPWSPTIGGTAMTVVDQAPCSILLARPPQAALRVEEVMVRRVRSVTPETPLSHVVELLLRLGVKALPVIDPWRRAVGIITGGDLLIRGDIGLRLSLQKELGADALKEQLRVLAGGGKTARDIMTRPVRSVKSDADLMAAIGLMAMHRVKRLPVVNDEERLIGIVSRADILRAMAALPERAVQPEIRAHIAGGTVGDVFRVRVPVVPLHTLAEQVLVKVLESPLRRVIVTGEDGCVLGLISDRDLLQHVRPDTRPWLLRVLTGQREAQEAGEPAQRLAGPKGPLTASELMAPALFTVRPEDSLGHAIRLMVQHQVKRLIVVDEASRFLGLLDRSEILRALIP